MRANLVLSYHVEPLKVKLICRQCSLFDITLREENELASLYGWRTHPFGYLTGSCFSEDIPSSAIRQVFSLMMYYLVNNLTLLGKSLSVSISVGFFQKGLLFLIQIPLSTDSLIQSIKVHYGKFCLREPATLRGPKGVT